MRWRGGRTGGHGPQRGQIARLFEPCLLILLSERESHGYDLISRLSQFGLDSDLVDSGLAYRALRQMEMGGWIESDWQTGDGPARRVYRLTVDGRRALADWRDQLARTHEVIHRILRASSGVGEATDARLDSDCPP